VVSPATGLVYRDGGLRGDQLSERVVREIPTLLEEGGFAHVLCTWVREPGRDWAERPRRWLDGAGCDAWVLRLVDDDAWTYAVRWTSASGGDADATARWVEAYRALGIERLVTGAVVLRRRSGSTWFRSDEMALGYRGSAGDHVVRVFAAQDLVGGGDDALLAARLAPARGTALVVRRSTTGVDQARLAVDEGIRLGGRFDATALPLVERLDGTVTLREAAATVGAGDRAVAAVRGLVAKGLLAPAANP